MALGPSVLYAMKFDIHEPIVFALSSDIPELVPVRCA